MIDTKTIIKDFFIHLFTVIALSVSIGNLLSVLFSVIDKLFPDMVSTGPYYIGQLTDTLPRLALSSFAVLFPVYLVFSWYIAKDIQKFPEKKESAVRKIFLYLVLFLALATTIGSLVSVLYLFLGGELTLRFIGKVISVLFVALTVFTYYGYSLKRDFTKVTKIPVILSGISIVFLFSLIGYSIYLFGTPSEMRVRRFDDMRLTDLQSITYTVDSYVVAKGKLPVSIKEAYVGQRNVSATLPPQDPETATGYVYEIVEQPKTNLSQTSLDKGYILSTDALYKLCARFSQMSDPKNIEWAHDTGLVCFTKKVLKD